MSVIKSKRQESKIEFLNNVYDLQVATYQLVIKFPKRYTFILSNPVALLSQDCHIKCKNANSIFPSNQHEFQIRRDYINAAIGDCQNLSSQIDIAYNLFPEIKGFIPVIALIVEQFKLLKGLKDSDKKRFKHLK